MISLLKNNNENNYFDMIGTDGLLNHSGKISFYIFFNANEEYVIQTILRNKTNSNVDNKSFIIIYDENDNIVKKHTGLEDFTFSFETSGRYKIISGFNEYNAVKSLKIIGDSSNFLEMNYKDSFRLNNISLSDINREAEQQEGMLNEISLKNETANKVYISSEDTVDTNHPLINVLNSDIKSYALFKMIYAPDSYSGRGKDSVSVKFSFPKKENVCLVLLDFAFDIDVDVEYEEELYYELWGFPRFSYCLNLYGSNNDLNWEQVGTIYPEYKHYIDERQVYDKFEEHTLFLTENTDKSDEYGGIRNPYNPRLLVDFKNKNFYKYYKLELKALKINYDYDVSSELSFQISGLKCYPYKQSNAPIAYFPLTENTNEINGFVKNETIGTKFKTIENKQCLQFNDISKSYVSFPYMFLSQDISEFTASLFVYKPNDTNDSLQYIMSKLENSGWGISLKNEGETTTLSVELYVDGFLTTCNTNVPKNQFCDKWNHLAFTFDKNVLCFYVNGEMVSKTYTSGNITTGTYSYSTKYYYRLYFGCENKNNGQSNFFSGYMREITFYKSALIKRQIKQIYKKGI